MSAEKERDAIRAERSAAARARAKGSTPGSGPR
jgi:hypothetical protein